MQSKTTQRRSRFLLTLTGGVLTLASGCSPSTQISEATESPSPVSFPSPFSSAASPASPSSASDPIVDAEDAAQGAIALTQSAVSPEDWRMVVQQWQRAIALLESIPKSDPQKTAIQDKLAGYKQNLAYAQQQAQNKNARASQSSNPPRSGIIAVTGSSSEKKSENAPSNKKTSQPASPGNTPAGQPQSDSSPSNSANPQPAASGNSTPSQSAKLTLAQHLTSAGAKMYGTFWCGACQYQREEFGEAFGQVVEIECDPRGKNPQPDLCRQAGVKAFPTWEVNGQLYQGVRSLDELADLSGYQGDRNFN
jgi:hypothetical protein